MGKSSIYFIRHGITEGNQKMWFYGSADIPLAEEGKAELWRLLEKGIYPAINEDTDCYTTGLLRTEQTFEILFGKHPHRTIENLQEMKFGRFECHSFEELKDDEEFSAWCYDESGDVALTGGESRNEFTARISKGLGELIGYHRLKELSHRHSGMDCTSVMVCHGGVISAIMQELFPCEKGNMWDWMIKPGFGFRVDFQHGEAVNYMELTEMKKLGFGLMRLPMKGDDIDLEESKKLVDLFMEKGFNYFDTAWGYQDGKSEEAAREILVKRYPRESFQLATKLPAWCANSKEEAHAMFDTSLERTGAGYFDYFLLHNIGAERTALFEEYGIWDFLAEKKAQGLIKHLGFSMHDTAENLEKILIAHPEMDFVQLQINYADWERPRVQSRKCYEMARKYHKPIIVMEPVKGGSLACLPESVSKIFEEADSKQSLSSWALRFAGSLDGVMTVLSGMNTLQQVEENTSIMGDFSPLSKEELQVVEKAREALAAMPQVPCTSCRYCVDKCPQGIAIPGIFRAMNSQMIYGNRKEAERNYAWETQGVNIASKCIGCGSCEAVCPQRIEISAEMKKAAEMFE